MHRSLPFYLVGLLLSTAAGCGARSTLEVPAAGNDAGQPSDSGLDGGVDSGPPDGGTLTVDCGRSMQFTTPRRPITLEGDASGPAAIVEKGWSLVMSPPGSMPLVEPSPDPSIVTVTPDVLGSVFMRFSALDSTGRRASCDVEIQAVVGPPVAICPEEELFTPAGTPILVMGDGFDDEAVVAYRWELVSVPAGATPVLTRAEEPVAELRSDTRGPHVLRLTVTDADMATDSCEVTVLVTGPPDVVCPEPSVTTPTRQPVTLRARATDDVGIASRRWEVIERPARSSASPSPENAETTTLTPDRKGRYLVRFTATDVEGMSASCDVTVNATPVPPIVSCPPRIETRPLTTVSVNASADDDGTIVSWRWGISSRPPGSATAPPAPADAASTRFTPDIAGVYTLTVTATDDDGLTGTCTTRIDAGNVDGLRVEMFWDTDNSDMDLHLLNPTATEWTSDGDCYWSNCISGRGGRLEWGAPGPDDNPRLDIDNVSGRGPENINITRPVPGTYRVGVHAYRGSGGPTHRVTVRIYCGGSTTEPQRTFGPITLGTRRSHTENDFWRVADVTLTASGCTIADLSRPGGPWIEQWNATRTRR